MPVALLALATATLPATGFDDRRNHRREITKRPAPVPAPEPAA
jgi:hypothetical protein